MACVNIHTHFPTSTLSFPSLLPCFPPTHSSSSSSSFSKTRKPCLSASVSAMMEPQSKKFKEFPYVSATIKDLMLELVSCVETRLGSSLLPCSLPPDVQYYQTPDATAQGTLHVRSGNPTSPVDFMLGSWIHSKLPSGGALNITTLSTYLKLSTDAPNFFIDIIQTAPTSIVLILDMPPRRDLVLYPDYLREYYEDTGLDRHRQLLEELPEVTPYSSPSLYIRAFISPTAISVRIQAEAGETTKIEEIIRDHVRPTANEIIKIWLDSCASVNREVGDADMAYLAKRDLITRTKSIEIELGTSIPSLFGQQVADRVLGVLRGIFNA